MPLNNQSNEFVKGQKLIVTLLDNRSMECSFRCKSEARKSIVFHNVSLLPDGKTFEQLEFKFDEILNVTSLETEKNKEINSDESSNLIISDDSSSVVPNSVLYENLKDCVEQHVFIDEIDTKFAEAIKSLDKCYTVGLIGEGSNQGRFGHLSILGVATNNCIFLFDLVNLGATAFKAGNNYLKRALESNKLLKVVHNCSLLADCLKHRYNIKLQNVFDTQACHFLTVKNELGCPPTSASFSDLVTKYLNLPGTVFDDHVKSSEVRLRRPVDEGVVRGTAWRVILLRRLHQCMFDALLAPFDNLCNFYLNTLRDENDDHEQRHQAEKSEKVSLGDLTFS